MKAQEKAVEELIEAQKYIRECFSLLEKWGYSPALPLKKLVDVLFPLLKLKRHGVDADTLRSLGETFPNRDSVRTAFLVYSMMQDGDTVSPEFFLLGIIRADQAEGNSTTVRKGFLD